MLQWEDYMYLTQNVDIFYICDVTYVFLALP